MKAWAFVIAAIYAVFTIPGGVSVADEEDDYETSVFPIYVWLDAFTQEPEEYAYCKSSRSDWGSGCSVLTEVWGPGMVAESFSFYDENDNLVGSAYACVYVDEYGFTMPCEFRYGWGSRSNWRSNFSGPVFKSGSHAKSLYEYPWPEISLEVARAVEGPGMATCRASGNIPDEWMLSYEWDLDNDEVFNRTTGRSPELTCEITIPGLYIFSVRATDLRGYVATASTEFTVQEPSQ